MAQNSILLLKEASSHDLQLLSYAEWIAGDYIDFIKTIILPAFAKQHPMKLRELRVLMTIAQGRKQITASEIAEFLRQDPATITRSTVVLIGQGYIVPSENYSDGRSRILNLSDKGREAADHFSTLFNEATSKIEESVNVRSFNTEQKDAANTVLDMIVDRARDLKAGKRKLGRLWSNKT